MTSDIIDGLGTDLTALRPSEVHEPWLVIFDLDGTLIDSSLDLANAVNAALAHIGRPPLDSETISSFVGDGAATLVRRALHYSAPSGVTDHERSFAEVFTFFLDFYRQHKLDNTRTYDGVLNALQTIRARRPALPMAVLTNKPVRPSREICDHLGLSSFFFANYGGDSFATKKPDPEGFRQLVTEARSLHLRAGVDTARLTPGGVVMVGDSAVDVATARACGARAIGCSYGLSPDSLLVESPDVLVNSPGQWLAALHL